MSWNNADVYTYPCPICLLCAHTSSYVFISIRPSESPSHLADQLYQYYHQAHPIVASKLTIPGPLQVTYTNGVSTAWCQAFILFQTFPAINYQVVSFLSMESAATSNKHNFYDIASQFIITIYGKAIQIFASTPSGRVKLTSHKNIPCKSGLFLLLI